MSAYAEVVVTLPVEGRFHYAVPEHLADALEIGHRVLVPFGKRRVTGFVVALADEVPAEVAKKVRKIEQRLDAEPLLPRDVLALATFAAEYYLATPGEVLKLAMPPGITASSKARWVITAHGRHWLESGSVGLPSGARLTGAQRKVLEAAVKVTGVRAGEVPAKTAGELEALGLIARKETIAAKEAKGGEVEVFERVAQAELTAPAEQIPAALKKRSRRALYERLARGPATIDALVSAVGTRRTLVESIRELEDAGLIRRRRVASTAAARADGADAPAVDFSGEKPPPLTAEQEGALTAILARIDAKTGGAFLLHGVTGSGKTEVYLRAIAHARALQRGAIVLVPEIALTPQLEARFRARFGDDVAVLHSALSDAERRRRWQRLRRGEAHIALGPRSAIWAPVHDAAVFVVDEEHDSSFKQGSDVRYNGRDLALTRAHRAGGVAILGSATPSLESLQAAATGKLIELRMRERVGGRPMPTVEMLDLTEERDATHGEPRVLSRALADALRAVVAKKGQAILFLNRRGFNTIVYCDDCGAARRCVSCDVSMTHHQAGGSARSSTLVCHYCGRVEPLESPCRECKSIAMRPFGVGTQRVTEAVRQEVPDARVLRLDRDATAHAGELDRTLAAFREGKADVLVGTQMVAKGHDFPGVTLVGIILADASLAFPDFRAAERTFQLMTQVAGRAGRAENPGHVIIQTFQRHHYALSCALHHDTERFFAIESESRRQASYPPFARLGLIRFESKDRASLDRATARARRAAEHANRDVELRWRGPVAAPIAKLRDHHRQMMMLTAPTPAKLVAAMRRMRAELEDAVESRVAVIYDVDALDLL